MANRTVGTCAPPLHRRTLLQAGCISLLNLGMNHVSALRASDVVSGKDDGRAGTGGQAKSVIFIFLSGGLSQIDSFDPKPEAPQEIRGDFSAIRTKTPGIQVCEHLPLLAQCSDKWSLVRSLTSPHNGHSAGHMTMLTGRSPLPPAFNGSMPQRTDWPSIASVVGSAVPTPTNNLPPAIALPERIVHRTGRALAGQFGGQMGSQRDPWFIEASPFNPLSYGAYPDYEFHFAQGRMKSEHLKFEAPNLSLPQGLTLSRLESRNALLSLVGKQRTFLDTTVAGSALDHYREAALSLLTDARVQKAFDVQNAPAKTLDQYGRNSFGWSLLMARQLVQAGVRLVQVNLGNNESWDTHGRNFPLLRDCLLPPMDRAVTALINDLHSSGALDETLIVMCSEMGRTPKVNYETLGGGRNHWGAVQTVFMAGGGVPGGCIVGSSDKDGAYPQTNPQRPENMAATIYHALGIPATAIWKDEVDRPHNIYHGEPIRFS